MYRADIGNATAAFVGDIGNLQTAVDGGDAAAAKSDELAAQAQYDAFRLLESGNAVNASSLDELATDVDPGGSFAGLHAVERDLWSSAKAAADVVGHAAQAPVAQYLLSRDRLAPEAIGTTAVDGRIFAFGSTGFSGSSGWPDAQRPRGRDRIGPLDQRALVLTGHPRRRVAGGPLDPPFRGVRANWMQ